MVGWPAGQTNVTDYIHPYVEHMEKNQSKQIQQQQTRSRILVRKKQNNTFNRFELWTQLISPVKLDARTRMPSSSESEVSDAEQDSVDTPTHTCIHTHTKKKQQVKHTHRSCKRASHQSDLRGKKIIFSVKLLQNQKYQKLQSDISTHLQLTFQQSGYFFMFLETNTNPLSKLAMVLQIKEYSNGDINCCVNACLICPQTQGYIHD